MSWTDVRQMVQQGFQIGAHTRTHPRLNTVAMEQARGEIEGSREILARNLAVPILTFCYPYGDHTPALHTVAEQAGFLASCSSESGLSSPSAPPQALRRVEIQGRDSLLGFAVAVLSGERLKKLRWSIRQW